MKGSFIRLSGIAVGLMLIFFPALGVAETPPSVASPLVREGAFAERLAEAFGLGAGGDEILAESRLGELGISPRNGWIADYPVTPDIAGEIQQSIIESADSSRLGMSREEALNRFYDVNMNLGLAVIPDADDSIRRSSSENYPPAAAVDNYYSTYGPPVVTYYAPPPGYMYLYGWVPYPFWYSGFWFPGFYVLHDFHYPVVYSSRTCFVSNHYRDLRYHRSYVVDPVHRFHGGTVYGVGAPRGAHMVYRGGNPRVAHEVLKSSRDRMMRAAKPAYTGRSTAPSRSAGISRQAPAGKRIAVPSQERPALKPGQDGRTAVQPRPVAKSPQVTREKMTGRQSRDRKDIVQPRPAVASAPAVQVKNPGPSARERKVIAPGQNPVNPPPGRIQNIGGHVPPTRANANGRTGSQPGNYKAMAPRQADKSSGLRLQPAQHRGPERGNAERGGRGGRG